MPKDPLPWWQVGLLLVSGLAGLLFVGFGVSNPDRTATGVGTDRSVQDVVRQVAIQQILDEEWPLLGLAYEDNPGPIDKVADTTCETIAPMGATEERGQVIVLAWESLDNDTASLFDGLEDFARFLGRLANATCPG